MRWIAWISSLVLGLLTTGADAQESVHSVSNYSFESWDERDGLPSARVWAITQDADGYLWLGTEVGLVRFDGLRFVRWSTNPGALPEDLIVSSIHSSSDRSMWLGFAASRGIGRIREGRLDRYGAQAGVGSGSIQFLVEDTVGTIWAGDSAHVYRFRDEQWERAGAEDGLPDTGGIEAHEDREGNFWITTNTGAFRRRPGQQRFEPVGRSTELTRLSEDLAGRILSTGPLQGFAALGAVVPRAPGDPWGVGLRIVHDHQNVTWIGTRGQGLWRSQRDPVSQKLITQRFTVADGLSSDSVRSIFVDRQSNVWVGTDEGLHRFTIRKIKPLTNSFSWAAQATADGSVWVATIDGLVRFFKEGQKRYTVADGLPSQAIRAFSTDARGTLWVATDGGVARRVDDRFESIPLGQTLPPITSIGADSRGTVWMSGLQRGAFVWSAGHLQPVPPPPGDSGDTATFVYVDRHDRAWIGYDGGTVTVRAAEGETIVHPLGDAIGSILTAVFEDSESAIWLGGTRGLARIRGSRIDVVQQPSRLPGNGIFGITQDADGYVWIGVNSGILRMSVSEFEQAARQPQYRPHYQLYDESDGLVGVLRRQGFPGATRTANGELWFVTSRGVSVVEPASMQPFGEAPPVGVRIERASADDRTLALAPGTALPAGTSRLLFEYTATNLTAPRKERFQYRLEGVDENWVDAGARREAFYSNLRSGAYRFQVARLTDTGVLSAPAVWEFSIRPMFYETWWFVLSSVAVALGFVGAAWRVRLRQVRRQFALVFSERARMSRELHDTILQSLVGVSLHLNEIAGSLKDARATEANEILGLRRYLDKAVVQAREVVWDLRSGDVDPVDVPTALRELGTELFEGKSARFEITTIGEPFGFTKNVERNLMRIAREAIGNAARHSNASVVSVALQYGEKSFGLEVSDNGIGFQPPDETGEPASHYGFLIMKERAEQAGGQYPVESSPGRGTRIQIVVPRT